MESKSIICNLLFIEKSIYYSTELFEVAMWNFPDKHRWHFFNSNLKAFDVFIILHVILTLVNIKSNIISFADYTMLYFLFFCTWFKNFSENLNEDLEVICRWPNQWKLKFNPNTNKQAVEIIFYSFPVSLLQGNTLIDTRMKNLHYQIRLWKTSSRHMSFTNHLLNPIWTILTLSTMDFLS